MEKSTYIAQIVLLLFGLSHARGELEVRQEWNVVNFHTPPGYPVDPNYKGTTTPILGIESSGDGRLFVSTPRFWRGNPASLSLLMDQRDSNGSPLLQAYPDWSWHKSAASERYDDCEGIISVYRMRVDCCQHLWVLDSGVYDFEDYHAVCPPKILVFDTRTDRLVKRITLPDGVIGDKPLLTNIVLFNNGTDWECLDSTVAILSDTYSPAIITYDARTSRFSRLTHPSMHPDPHAESFSFSDSSFHLSDGVIGMALDSRRQELYFQPLSSYSIFKVPVEDLLQAQNGYDLQVTLVTNKPSQSVGLDFGTLESGKEALVYSTVSENNLVLLNPTSLEKTYVVDSAEKLQFVSDIKIKNGQIWMASNRFQKFVHSSVNTSETNLRILTYVTRL